MEGMGRLCDPASIGVEPGTGAGLLPQLEEGWLALCSQLFSTHGGLRQAQLEQQAKDPRFIETIHRVRRGACACAVVEWVRRGACACASDARPKTKRWWH